MGCKMSKKIRLSFAATVQLFFLLIIANTFAQVDPAKVLVGTWEGQVEATLSSGNQRVLIINSVKKTSDTEWVARGRFNLPDLVNTEDRGGQEMTVTLKDNDIVLDFVTGKSRSPIHLQLVGDNRLQGTINTTERGQKRPSDKRMVLEKKSSQAN